MLPQWHKAPPVSAGRGALFRNSMKTLGAANPSRRTAAQASRALAAGTANGRRQKALRAVQVAPGLARRIALPSTHGFQERAPP